MNSPHCLRAIALGFVMCVAFCSVSVGCAGKAENAGKPQNVLATVRALEAEPTLDPAGVGAALDADLRIDPEQSDGSFTHFVGTVRSGAAGDSDVDAVDVRMPAKGNTTAKGPLVYLTFKQGSGPTMDDVVDLFGRATNADVPPVNPEKALVLRYTTPRGQLRFGIGSSAARPVVSATIDRTE